MLGLIRVPYVIRVLCVLGNQPHVSHMIFGFFRLDLDSLLFCQG